MGSSAPTLDRLRRSLIGLDPSLAPALPDGGRQVSLEGGLDAALGGGLACAALHEIAPADPVHLAAATGFALAAAVRSGRERGETLWIATEFAGHEEGRLYGPGLARFGLDPARILVLRVRRVADALWAMEEALRSGALASVVAEWSGEEADLTATRRLALAARDGGGALGLLLHHRVPSMPSAVMTRWHVAAAPGAPDRYGGLGATGFHLSLVKNRRGPCGRWTLTWDHHDHVFRPAIPVGVAAPALDRPDRALLGRTG
jgi:protein ImuA